MELFQFDVVGLCYLPVDWSFYLNHSFVFYEPLYDARNCNLHKAGPGNKHSTGIWNFHGDLHISRKTGYVVAVEDLCYLVQVIYATSNLQEIVGISYLQDSEIFVLRVDAGCFGMKIYKHYHPEIYKNYQH